MRRNEHFSIPIRVPGMGFPSTSGDCAVRRSIALHMPCGHGAHHIGGRRRTARRQRQLHDGRQRRGDRRDRDRRGAGRDERGGYVGQLTEVGGVALSALPVQVGETAAHNSAEPRRSMTVP